VTTLTVLLKNRLDVLMERHGLRLLRTGMYTSSGETGDGGGDYDGTHSDEQFSSDGVYGVGRCGGSGPPALGPPANNSSPFSFSIFSTSTASPPARDGATVMTIFVPN
jgi:hypothetical protein